MSQSIFASPEPDTRPNDNTPTEIHVDDNNLGDSGANILQTSIEIDDDMDPSRVEDNKSPSELTQPYSTPVTYPPPPPTNDPTGFYTDGKFCSLFSANQSVLLLKNIPSSFHLFLNLQCRA